MNGEIDYGNFEDMSIQFGSGSDNITIKGSNPEISYITTGDGDDVVNVEKIDSETTIKLQAGNDVINVSNKNQKVDEIASVLIVSGGLGEDNLNVDDSGDTEDNTATIYDTLITGLGMNGEIDYGNFENLNIGMGSGSDILSIESTHQQNTNINTGIGSDIVNVENISGETKINLGIDDDISNIGDFNQKMDNINSILNISGDSGNDILNIDDYRDTQNNTAIVKRNQITGFG